MPTLRQQICRYVGIDWHTPRCCPTEPILFNQRPELELFELFEVIEARTPVDEQSSTNILRENSITKH